MITIEFTYEEIAEVLGCTKKTVYNKMKGKSDFTMSELLKLTQYFQEREKDDTINVVKTIVVIKTKQIELKGD